MPTFNEKDCAFSPKCIWNLPSDWTSMPDCSIFQVHSTAPWPPFDIVSQKCILNVDSTSNVIALHIPNSSNNWMTVSLFDADRRPCEHQKPSNLWEQNLSQLSRILNYGFALNIARHPSWFSWLFIWETTSNNTHRSFHCWCSSPVVIIPPPPTDFHLVYVTLVVLHYLGLCCVTMFRFAITTRFQPSVLVHSLPAPATLLNTHTRANPIINKKETDNAAIITKINTPSCLSTTTKHKQTNGAYCIIYHGDSLDSNQRCYSLDIPIEK